jgi:hypothetical protein
MTTLTIKNPDNRETLDPIGHPFEYSIGILRLGEDKEEGWYFEYDRKYFDEVFNHWVTNEDTTGYMRNIYGFSQWLNYEHTVYWSILDEEQCPQKNINIFDYLDTEVNESCGVYGSFNEWFNSMDSSQKESTLIRLYHLVRPQKVQPEQVKLIHYNLPPGKLVTVECILPPDPPR